MRKAIYYDLLPGHLPDRERLELAKQAGFQGVEISQYETIEQAVRVAELAKDVGVEVHSMMGSTHWTLPLSATDPEVRAQGVAGVRAGLEQAQAVGAAVLLVVPWVVTEDVSYAAAHEIAEESLRELVPAAEERGVVMGLENVWNKFLLSPLEMRDCIDGLGSPYVQAYFDVGNILLYGYPHHWIEVLGARIAKVHVKDFEVGSGTFVGLLQGSVDYPRVMNALRGVGYDNYLTVEVPAYRQYPEQFVYDAGVQLERIIRS